MRRILVTGSSGKLGKEIVRLLKSNHYEVLGIDLLKAETTHEIVDIRDSEAVIKVTAGIDAIIHTAALHGKHSDLNYPRDQFINTNIIGTNNLLSASIANGINKFVYTSTTSIYGDAMVNDKQAVFSHH